MKDSLKTVEYTADLCVVGGGLAGLCAAVAAAREGISVVLMQERPMLGGNASSEIRMWVCGARGQNVRETGILEEINLENLYRNPCKLYPIWDSVLWETVKKEKNITLLLNCSCMDAETEAGRILSVTGWQMTTQRFCRVRAGLFADCSGDSILAPLCGAHFRTGRESAAETGEVLGQPEADNKTMGASCLIQARKGTEKVAFIPPEFAKKLTDEDLKFRRPNLSATHENFWYLELGGDRDSIADTEQVRDELVALAYGMWDYIKNSGTYPDADYWQLDFLGFLPGKRESRRMTGKYTLTQTDVSADTDFEDTAAYGGWPLDDHDPAGFYHVGHPNVSVKTPSPYAIPYRCLYSENVSNLFFAGRNISMTHAAMSSTRVMATCALCGQAVGTAAAIAAAHGTDPDGVYRGYVKELQERLLWNDCMLPRHPRTPSPLTAAGNGNVTLSCSDPEAGSPDVLRDGRDRDNVFDCAPGSVIEYGFASPADLRQVRIVFDSDLDRVTLPGDKCERVHSMRANLLPDSPVMHLPTTLCRAYRLEVLQPDGTTELLREESENRRRLVLVPCAGPVSALRLTLLSAHAGGERMRLFSFEAK